jgi:predicted RNA binding protein YcfA (HicA-like mRNA interferase family)
MTKPPKLYGNLLSNAAQTVSFRDFERLLTAFGFNLARVKGSHRAYVHAAVPRPMIVQPRGGDAKPYQVRQFLDMVEEFGLSLEE